MRIALGYDLHRVKESPNDSIPCGGVLITCDKKIDGAHSDGDVVLHALTDALLSVKGYDIGEVFPNTDPINKNRSSIEFLEYALNLIPPYHIINVDIVVICDTPKIAPHSLQIRTYLASVLNISIENIMIRGKTTENTSPNTIQAYTNVLFKK